MLRVRVFANQAHQNMNRLKNINIENQITFESNHLRLLISFLEKPGIGPNFARRIRFTCKNN